MALSKKTFQYLAAFVVVLVVTGFGAVHYIQKSVVDAVRAQATRVPENLKLTLGDVTYSLFANTLTLKDSSMTATFEGGSIDANTQLVVIKNPNIDLLSIIHDPAASIPETMRKEPLQDLADEIRLERVAVTPVPNTLPKATLDSLVITTIRIDPVRTQNIAKAIASKDKDQILQSISEFPEALAYAKLAMKNLSAEMPSEVGVITFSLAGETQKNYDRGHADSIIATDLKIATPNVFEIFFAELAAFNLNPPSDDLTKKLIQQMEDADDGDVSAELFFSFCRQMFGNTQPLVEKMELKGARFQVEQLAPVTLEDFVYTNPKTSPFTYSFKMTKLVIPAEISPQIAMIKMAGLKDINLSWEASGTFPNPTDGLYSKQFSLSVVDLGDLQIQTLGQIDPKTYNELLHSPKELVVVLEQLFDAVKISQITLNYADKGLLPRAVRLNSQFSGQNADAFIEAQKKELDTLSPKNVKAATDFLQHPGSIEIKIKPEPPLALMQFIKIPNNSPAITITTTPSPKTLKELVVQLNQPAVTK